MKPGCTALLSTMLRLADGPFTIEVVGCRECEEAYVAFVTEDDKSHTINIAPGLSAMDAAKQAVRLYVNRKVAA